MYLKKKKKLLHICSSCLETVKMSARVNHVTEAQFCTKKKSTNGRYSFPIESGLSFPWDTGVHEHWQCSFNLHNCTLFFKGMHECLLRYYMMRFELPVWICAVQIPFDLFRWIDFIPGVRVRRLLFPDGPWAADLLSLGTPQGVAATGSANHAAGLWEPAAGQVLLLQVRHVLRVPPQRCRWDQEGSVWRLLVFFRDWFFYCDFWQQSKELEMLAVAKCVFS